MKRPRHLTGPVIPRFTSIASIKLLSFDVNGEVKITDAVDEPYETRNKREDYLCFQNGRTFLRFRGMVSTQNRQSVEAVPMMPLHFKCTTKERGQASI